MGGGMNRPGPYDRAGRFGMGGGGGGMGMGGVGMGMGYGMGRGGRNVKGKFNNTVEWLITQLNQDITVKSELHCLMITLKAQHHCLLIRLSNRNFAEHHFYDYTVK